MEDAADMRALPEDEQRSVWAETERNYWRDFDRENSQAYARSEQEYRRQASSMKADLERLTSQRHYLTQKQERLSRELTQAEQEMARTVEARDKKAMVLNELQQEYHKNEQAKLEKRSTIATAMKRFFRMKQNKDSDASSQRIEDSRHETLEDLKQSQRSEFSREAAYAETLAQAQQVTRDILASSSSELVQSPQRNTPGDELINVVDADGHVIGPVRQTEPWNQWVEAIQNVPVKRQVKIRRGRKFTKEHLATIYDRTEAKGVKWIACMIQATGEVQPQRCLSCDKNQGAFDDCVVLGGHLFQKCGNCEWNRQGCHMPLTNADREDARGRVNTHLNGNDFDNMGQAGALSRYNLQTTRPHRIVNGNGNGPEPFQLPAPGENRDQPFAHFGRFRANAVTAAFTPANTRNAQSLNESLTPLFRSVESPARLCGADQGEITSRNLSLRHNGVFYTYPECVEGVPLVKIDENHPYWDPRWPSVQSIIEPQLETWRIKYEEASKRKAKGEGGSAKFQTGRQVNRGTKILEFLKEGDISPYQLLSKKYTHTGKGTITAYDTLFRMCETLGELAKYGLDISPVEWLRHRLHELIMEQGAHFNYSKIMHDFYHDPKLLALRDKKGFKSIGRPSGLKAGQSSGKSASALSTNSPPEILGAVAMKRKTFHSQANTPRATPSAGHSPQSFFDDYNPPPLLAHAVPYVTESSFIKGYTPKRLKPLSPQSAGPNEGFHTGTISDTDSHSGAPLEKLDWRISQVKTRVCASDVAVTQYWHWKEDRRIFEHRVLKDTKEPTIWGSLPSPIDFHVPLDDIVQVDWNLDTLRAHFVVRPMGSVVSRHDGKPRGDLMAAFKRQNTMRRFLDYCRERRLRLVKITADEMGRRWASMKPEQLPATDEEASSVSAPASVSQPEEVLKS